MDSNDELTDGVVQAAVATTRGVRGSLEICQDWQMSTDPETIVALDKECMEMTGFTCKAMIEGMRRLLAPIEGGD